MPIAHIEDKLRFRYLKQFAWGYQVNGGSEFLSLGLTDFKACSFSSTPDCLPFIYGFLKVYPQIHGSEVLGLPLLVFFLTPSALTHLLQTREVSTGLGPWKTWPRSRKSWDFLFRSCGKVERLRRGMTWINLSSYWRPTLWQMGQSYPLYLGWLEAFLCSCELSETLLLHLQEPQGSLALIFGETRGEHFYRT